MGVFLRIPAHLGGEPSGNNAADARKPRRVVGAPAAAPKATLLGALPTTPAGTGLAPRGRRAERALRAL
eukprot:5682244-Alexandrium_andersonii.AAC.1